MTRRNQELETLGGRLKKQREALGLSIEDVAREVHAPLKYIYGLENDEFDIFSAKVYAQGFLRSVLEVVSMGDKETFLKEFGNEWEVHMFRKRPEVKPLPENRGEEPLLTPKRLLTSLSILGLLALLVFVGFRLTYFVGAPVLTIEAPEDRAEVSEPLIRVQGKAGKESRLTVNGREITIDAQGNFNDEIELGAGLNVLEFIAQNRFGKESRVMRYILVK